MPKLQINLPDGTQLDHELTDDTITIGRAPDNTLTIDDASVSSHHGKIEPLGDGNYALTDLGSTNGTRLNGSQLKEGEAHQLGAGDKVRFGKVDSVFDPDNATEEVHELPQDDHVAAVGKSSVKPSNFMNASPFQKKTEKKDPAGMGILALGAVAILAALAVAALTFNLSTTG
jgi:pSer/pThr/pTyr-binding forkhead associated (FHA) protein